MKTLKKSRGNCPRVKMSGELKVNDIVLYLKTAFIILSCI